MTDDYDRNNYRDAVSYMSTTGKAVYDANGHQWRLAYGFGLLRRTGRTSVRASAIDIPLPWSVR